MKPLLLVVAAGALATTAFAAPQSADRFVNERFWIDTPHHAVTPATPATPAKADKAKDSPKAAATDPGTTGIRAHRGPSPAYDHAE